MVAISLGNIMRVFAIAIERPFFFQTRSSTKMCGRARNKEKIKKKSSFRYFFFILSDAIENRVKIKKK